MADRTEPRPDNAPGTFYVDNSCDYCEVCLDEAPHNLKKSDRGEYSIVFKQPENKEEEQDLRNAMDVCPNESIGDDGV